MSTTHPRVGVVSSPQKTQTPTPQPIDFLAIGDLATDVFIKLKDAHVSCRVDTNACELCMRFGDKIPFESATEVRAVGNSANAAVSAARLGLSSALVSNIGDDAKGKEAIAELLKNGVSPKLVRSQAGKITNYHYVLWFESERTILIKHEAFEYTWKAPENPIKWVYLSSLGGNTETYHDEISAWLDTVPETKLAFQPGTFQLKLGIKRLKKIYERADVFVCNTQEAQQLLDVDAQTPIETLLVDLHAVGPKIVLITDGPKGAYSYDGKTIVFQPPYPDPAPPVERTGAGDAFASTFVSALALGHSIETALSWAPINSMSVVQHIGAQAGLLKTITLGEYLSNAPKTYSAKKQSIASGTKIAKTTKAESKTEKNTTAIKSKKTSRTKKSQ